MYSKNFAEHVWCYLTFESNDIQMSVSTSRCTTYIQPKLLSIDHWYTKNKVFQWKIVTFKIYGFGRIL